MSRTYRTHIEHQVRCNGVNLTWEEEVNFLLSLGRNRWERSGLSGRTVLNRHDRDKKPWDKPCKSFKSMKRRIERARIKNAMQSGRDIPTFPKTDQYDWI